MTDVYANNETEVKNLCGKWEIMQNPLSNVHAIRNFSQCAQMNGLFPSDGINDGSLATQTMRIRLILGRIICHARLHNENK